MANDFQNPEHYSELGNSENPTSSAGSELLAEISKKIRRNVIAMCVLPSHFPIEQHDSVFKTMLPLGFDSITERRELSSLGLKDMISPLTSGIEMPPGFPFGATPGVGKSYSAKLLRQKDEDRIIVDIPQVQKEEVQEDGK